MSSSIRRYLPGLSLASVMGIGCAAIPGSQPITHSGAEPVAAIRAAESESETQGIRVHSQSQSSQEAKPMPINHSGVEPLAAIRAAESGSETQGIIRVQSQSQAPQDSKPLPINLDTVLRLAEGQNTHVALARARVEEAFAEKDLAAKAWLPSLNIGTAYYRHEGGISNPDGSFEHASFGNAFGGLDLSSRFDAREIIYQQVVAERQIWQQKGDLRKISTEMMLDAANTYLDLLAARTGQKVAEEMQADLEGLLARAKKLAAKEPSALVEVSRIQAQFTGRQQVILELKEQAARASAKLAYLIGVDPSTPLLPADERIASFDLVDATPPVQELVAQALRRGPGISEMEGLISLVHEAQASSGGLNQYLPILELRMGEGGFGTGVGSSSQWDNRWDLAVQARWNLTQLCTKDERQRVLQAKTQQAHLALRDLQAKLTSGVHEAREAITSGKEQIRLAEEYTQEAKKALQLSKVRLEKNVAGSSTGEVLMQLNALSLAQASYLNCVRNYDKAQMRLMVLLGCTGGASGR